jgi:hypothetical protein
MLWRADEYKEGKKTIVNLFSQSLNLGRFLKSFQSLKRVSGTTQMKLSVLSLLLNKNYSNMLFESS